ncbi:MAG: hypothetical protein K8H88_20775 [Sandaracinaceae bacterium]|nr:hypothetical protein [Sandaracinaceae bacterium]
MTRALFMVLASALLGGCGLVLDPCGDLDELLCADLGPDCATFRSEPGIYGAVIPQGRRKSDRAQCEMFVADENYASYTLPFIQGLIRQRRDPSARMPALRSPHAVDGLASGVSSYFFYCVPFIVIPGILFFSWRARKNLGAAQRAPGTWTPITGTPFAATPFAATPFTAGWDHVDSREKAEEQARLGALVPVELLPSWLGGQRVPENVVYLPPHAAAQKAAVDQHVAQLLRAGQSIPFAVEPQYRGASFVPVRLIARLGPESHTIEVW